MFVLRRFSSPNTHKRQHGGKSRKPGRHLPEFNGSHKPHGLYLPLTQGRGHSRNHRAGFPRDNKGALMHYYGSHLNVNVAKCLTQIGSVPKRFQEETQQQQEDPVQTDSTLFSAHTVNKRSQIRKAVSSKLSMSGVRKRQDYKLPYIE